MINRCVLGLCAALASCAQPSAPPPPGPVAFTIGQPYQAGPEWRYPRDFNSYDVTGLATVIPDGSPLYTADNETYDPQGLTAQSPVLQLPCIVTVTNLVNGDSMEVRVNDHGPMTPGRVIAVTPRVAQLLAFPSGGIVEVEVTLDSQASAALEGSLGAGPKLTAAPVAGITAQSLGPPGGSAGAVQNLAPAQSTIQTQTVQLSGAVTTLPPSPGPLYVQIPGFGSESDAFQMLNRLYGIPAQIVPQQGDSRVLYAVNAGPYHSVADADAALAEILGLGIPDPEIIVR
jgi:rare lipoprotein A